MIASKKQYVAGLARREGAQASLQVVHDAIAALQRLTDTFQDRRIQLARTVGLSEQQWRVLEEISLEHFIPSLFAKDRDSSPAAVSKIIRQLLDKDLIHVSISEEDGRQRDYALTALGQHTMKRLREERQHAIEAIWMRMKPADLEHFRDITRHLTQAIEAYAQQKEP